MNRAMYKEIKPDCDYHSLDFLLEEIKVLWAFGNESEALQSLKELMESDRIVENRAYKTRVYLQYAKWVYKRKTESPRVILQIFEQAASLALLASEEKLFVANSNAYKSIGSSFYHFAKFADNSYQSLCSDETLKSYIELIKEKQEELRDLKMQLANSPDSTSLKLMVRRLTLQLKLDQSEIARQENDKNDFLLKVRL
jgi:hypothetical protein